MTATATVAPARRSSWLDPAERAAERELLAAAQAGDSDAVTAVVERYTPLLRTFAWRLGGIAGVVDREDLVAVAQAELVARLGDLELTATQDNPLAYLLPRLRGAMIDHLRANDTRPRSVTRRQRTIKQAQADLEQASGRAVSFTRAAAHVGIDGDELAYCSRSIGEVSTAALGGQDDDDRPWEPADLAAAADAEQVELAELAGWLLDALDERSRHVIEQTVLGERGLREVGDELGVSESRVCQLRAAALAKLRVRLGNTATA